MRFAVTVLLVLLILGGLAALKGAQLSALADAGEQAQQQGPPPEAVATARASLAAWGETIEAVGSVSSSKDVTVPGEVPGTFTRVAFVDFTVPQNRRADIREGTRVRIELEEGSEQSIEGTVIAIAPSVDERARSVQLRASVPNQNQLLRTGTFVDVAVLLPNEKQHVIVRSTAIVHSTHGDSVFVVEDKKKNAQGMRTTPDGKPVQVARQQFVRTGPRRGDYVAVLAGLRAGQEVVIAGGFKLRNGAPIVISQDASPQAKLDAVQEAARTRLRPIR